MHRLVILAGLGYDRVGLSRQELVIARYREVQRSLTHGSIAVCDQHARGKRGQCGKKSDLGEVAVHGATLTGAKAERKRPQAGQGGG